MTLLVFETMDRVDEHDADPCMAAFLPPLVFDGHLIFEVPGPSCCVHWMR